MTEAKKKAVVSKRGRGLVRTPHGEVHFEDRVELFKFHGEGMRVVIAVLRGER